MGVEAESFSILLPLGEGGGEGHRMTTVLVRGPSPHPLPKGAREKRPPPQNTLTLCVRSAQPPRTNSRSSFAMRSSDGGWMYIMWPASK